MGDKNRKFDCTLKCTCSHCGKDVDIECNRADVEAHNEGKFVQDAFPYLTADEREIMVSGLCGECFDKLFSRDEL